VKEISVWSPPPAQQFKEELPTHENGERGNRATRGSATVETNKNRATRGSAADGASKNRATRGSATVGGPVAEARQEFRAADARARLSAEEANGGRIA
jgi:hypothetical protein